MNRQEFLGLMERMADGWNRCDGAAVLACCAEDIVYGDPTRYAFRGLEGLREFFKVPPGETQTMKWHRLIFDESAQTGAGEYTYEGTHRYHGAVLVGVANGKVSHWREWQHTAPLPWDEFVRGPKKT